MSLGQITLPVTRIHSVWSCGLWDIISWHPWKTSTCKVHGYTSLPISPAQDARTSQNNLPLGQPKARFWLWHSSNLNCSQGTGSWRQRRNYHSRCTNEPRRARDPSKETLHPCTTKISRCKENWPG
jgi:hypothetical protein